MTDVTSDRNDAARLAATVLEEEARRQAEQAASGHAEVVLPDDLLPGVGSEAVPLATVLRRHGMAMVSVLTCVRLVDELDRAAFGVLAPDIQKSLHVSDLTIGVIGALGGLVLFAAAVPIGALADRTRRTALTSICTAIWSVFAIFTGMVHAAWQLVVARTMAGIGKANETPVHGSLLADAYPPEARARVYALHSAALPIGLAAGPVIGGGIAALAGGGSGWRWAFVALSLPALVLAVIVGTLHEPARGKHEQLAVLGEELAPAGDELPISISAAFARLKRVKTFYYVMASLGALGFAVVTVPIYLNIVLKDTYGLGPGGRGVVGSLTALGGVVGVIVGGTFGDRLFRRNPELTMLLIGGGVAVLGVTLPLEVYAPNVAVLVIIGFLGSAATMAAFVPVSPVIAAVTPYRLRSMGFALIGLYLSLIGGLGGALIVGGLADGVGPRMAVAIVSPPACLMAGALIAYGSRFVRRDISRAAGDLLEERDERTRMAQGAAVPVLQVRNLDYSYGPVQVLFDVNVDVHQGEVLALLGTNGAGKSTLLRAISGLGVPDRGVVRFEGRTITYADPGTRVRLGVVQVPGGKAIFPTMSVRENLLAGARSFIWQRDKVNERIAYVTGLFPILAERIDQPAGTLSGGEQQMLGLATSLLLDPKVILIDELSLGLAPVIVQQLLEVVVALKQAGKTILVVEQSVNVALSIADRAVFMEKGQVRFEGPARDLLDRDDLVRAVFLGGEGG